MCIYSMQFIGPSKLLEVTYTKQRYSWFPIKIDVIATLRLKQNIINMAVSIIKIVFKSKIMKFYSHNFVS